MNSNNINSKLELLEANISMHKKMLELKQAIERRIENRKTKSYSKVIPAAKNHNLGALDSSNKTFNTPPSKVPEIVTLIPNNNTTLIPKTESKNRPLYIIKHNKMIRIKNNLNM
ncbi:hypothetical protein BB561_003627 [Smittium simulii]|uniref:Uncharacterized protein n=1 Tax=Smittium simulii TaxID=133385 RepID=A0A2T9YK77_9FUNG|nr:hypothetical protein BB561_003627 [Smittium simulii]